MVVALMPVSVCGWGGIVWGLVVVVWIGSIVMAIHNDEVDNIGNVVDASAADDDGDEDEKLNLLILVFFQNPVGVEHPSILHIFDIWTGGGGL